MDLNYKEGLLWVWEMKLRHLYTSFTRGKSNCDRENEGTREKLIDFSWMKCTYPVG